jgi:hypothetical protein
MTKSINPFRYFDSSPEVIRLVVMMDVRYALSLRNVEDFLFEAASIAARTASAPYDLDSRLRGDDSGLRPGHFSSLSDWALSLATRALAPPLDRVEAKSERQVASWLIEPL